MAYTFLLLILNGCYKEAVIETPNIDVLNFYMESEQENYLNESREVKFEIKDPKPDFEYRGDNIPLREMSLRGNTALRFHRKSFNIDLQNPAFIAGRNNQELLPFTEFRLLAMATDYTYIENRISYGFLEKTGNQPLFYKYCEVVVNNHTQGLYMLVENPEYYAVNTINSEIIIRRGYNASIDNFRFRPKERFTEQEYFDRFKNIYRLITKYEGKQLYDSLDTHLVLESYFKKIAVDYLLKNGDYTDEIYFYALPQDSSIRFDVLPWDYDDVFADEPHEINRDWGVGTVFGHRKYTSIQDILDDVGEKMIFSIEDDLDYTIARDSFLYSAYLEEIGEMLEIITPAFIESLFDRVEYELHDYFLDPEIIEQSKYDLDPCSPAKLNQNLQDKKTLLLERRKEMLELWEKR